jgi:hypothetical protein
MTGGARQKNRDHPRRIAVLRTHEVTPRPAPNPKRRVGTPGSRMMSFLACGRRLATGRLPSNWDLALASMTRLSAPRTSSDLTEIGAVTPVPLACLPSHPSAVGGSALRSPGRSRAMPPGGLSSQARQKILAGHLRTRRRKPSTHPSDVSRIRANERRPAIFYGFNASSHF